MMGVRWFAALALLACIALPQLLHADGQYVSAGGFTVESCTGTGRIPQITVTGGQSAYSAGNVVGSSTGTAGQSGVFPMQFFRPLDQAGRNSGILQSIRLIFRDPQVAEFDVRLMYGTPQQSTLTDKTAFSMATSDMYLLAPKIALTNNDNLGGNMTVYGVDQIARAIELPPDTGGGKPLVNVVLTTAGTPSFIDTHPMLCFGVLQD